jgi:hypothetical protein
MENGVYSKIDAILSLVGGNLAGESDGTNMSYHDGQTPPTEAEIDAKIVELETEFEAKSYQRDRQYPSIGDQLDMQYHDQLNSTTTWKDAIAKVKSDNPKE